MCVCVCVCVCVCACVCMYMCELVSVNQFTCLVYLHLCTQKVIVAIIGQAAR